MSKPASKAVLIVNGYIVIGAWARLKGIQESEGLAAARRALVDNLLTYTAYQGLDTHVVFDTRYCDAQVSCREVVTIYLSVHYTDPGQTADAYIEEICADFRHDSRKFHQRLIVATSDRAQHLTVIGYEAEWMSTTRLASEVELATSRVQRKQITAESRSNDLFLGFQPNQDSQKRLRGVPPQGANDLKTDAPWKLVTPGKIILRELEARGWTQEDLAGQLNLSHSDMDLVIEGKRSITSDLAVCMAKVFETSTDFWLNLEANYKRHTERNTWTSAIAKTMSSDK